MRKVIGVSIALTVLLLGIASTAAAAQGRSNCVPVGGALITDVNAIDNTYNLGPVWGDLRGAVAAKILSANSDGTYTLQHTWILETGDILNLGPSVRYPTYPDPNNKAVMAVPWDHYASEIQGGTANSMAPPVISTTSEWRISRRTRWFSDIRATSATRNTNLRVPAAKHSLRPPRPFEDDRLKYSAARCCCRRS